MRVQNVLEKNCLTDRGVVNGVENPGLTDRGVASGVTTFRMTSGGLIEVSEIIDKSTNRLARLISHH